jgi:hypothetical protein
VPTANRDGKTPVQAAVLGYARIHDVLEKEARPALMAGSPVWTGDDTLNAYSLRAVTFAAQNVVNDCRRTPEQLLGDAPEATFPRAIRSRSRCPPQATMTTRATISARAMESSQ